MLKDDFFRARREILMENVSTDGVGGLSEKSVHKMLKLALEPNVKNHEVEFLGSIADIKNAEGIFEIQTKKPERLIKKLEKFLPCIRVTLVIPLIKESYVRWINTETGEISEPRKSPKSDNIYTAFNMLYPVARFFDNPNFSVKLVFLSADSYKRLDGWDKTKKRGATKTDVIPSSIIDVIDLFSREDCKKYFPEGICTEFLAKDFSKAIKRPARFSYYVIKFFENVGIIEKIGEQGRAFVYRTVSDN